MAQGGRLFGGVPTPNILGGSPNNRGPKPDPPHPVGGSDHKKKPGRGTPLLFITDSSGAQRNSEEGREMMGRARGRLVQCEGKIAKIHRNTRTEKHCSKSTT